MCAQRLVDPPRKPSRAHRAREPTAERSARANAQDTEGRNHATAGLRSVAPTEEVRQLSLDLQPRAAPRRDRYAGSGSPLGSLNSPLSQTSPGARIPGTSAAAPGEQRRLHTLQDPTDFHQSGPNAGLDRTRGNRRRRVGDLLLRPATRQARRAKLQGLHLNKVLPMSPV